MNYFLPVIVTIPGWKVNSTGWESSNEVNGNDPRSLLARLVVGPVLGVPTKVLVWVEEAVVREVRGWPRMSPSRSK